MNTFTDLYAFLRSEEIFFLEWLDTPWEGKDKQESLLRLFTALGLMEKLRSFRMCVGNFNSKTIRPMSSIKEFFYDACGRPIMLKDKGDASDLTALHIEDPRRILATTCKNRNVLNAGSLDVDKLLTNFRQYEKDGYSLSLCICVRDTAEFLLMLNRMEKTTHELRSILGREDLIVLDRNDLHRAYHAFRRVYGKVPLEGIRDVGKRPLLLKLHQHMGVDKTLCMKREGTRRVLWGHIPRSGKSYMIAGVIIKDSDEKKNCNYLILTTAPNETIEQQLQVFDCLEFRDFHIVYLNGRNKKPVLKEKNIIVCSKQFLQSKTGNDDSAPEKTKSIAWLKKMAFDARFLDESHNGGTTALAQRTLDCYGKEAFTVQITATYSKPARDYDIPRESQILWDLEDVRLCKTIDSPLSMDRLVAKHGSGFRDALVQYPIRDLIQEYSKYPDLWILTDELKPEITSKVVEDTRANHYGWSPDACFLLKQGVKNEKVEFKAEFQNETEALKLWHRIFGKRNHLGIPDKEFPDDLVFLKRIEKICQNPSVNSRFFGSSGNNDPMIIMAFLPQNNIDPVSKATIRLLRKHNVIPDFEIVAINSKMTSDPKKIIEDARVRAVNGKKKGVLVLSGRQCSLGVSLHGCDIVLLLNNNSGFDLIYQMMFRCMTEAPFKKCGFVIDMNIHRVIETSILDYASLIRPHDHPRDAVRFLLQERLITLNGDHWMPCFGRGDTALESISRNAYEIYSANTERALKHFLDRLRFKEILLSQDDQRVFNTMFGSTRSTREQVELVVKLLEDSSDGVKKGIEKIHVEASTTKGNEDLPEQQKEKKVNYMDLLKHIIPLICLLTIHQEESSFVEMFHLVQSDPRIHEILLDQTRSWWGNVVSSSVLKKFLDVYVKHMSEDKEVALVIRTVKELFRKNLSNQKELSLLIDKYLIPQENEKKQNAEVSTPFKLRQEMLDTLPPSFWSRPRKVLEPCSGKGGFVVDIIDRFMSGLMPLIPDEKERYRVIVEECLYFVDINPTNIFLCRLLVDPYNEYKLNWHEGDTLKLDIREKWGIEGFDAVIGNPPYNSSGNTGTGNTIWQSFVSKAFDEWMLRGNERYIVMVHPSGWRKPNTEKGKFTGLYHKMVSENHMRRLSIHGVKDGMKTFRCGTRYDWYVIERLNGKGKKTRIRDEEGKEVEEIMNDGWEWFPNHSHERVKRLLTREGEERCPIMYSRTAYGADKKQWMSKEKDDKFKHPCIHSTPKTGVRYMYSSVKDRGMFGIPKLIFGESGIGHIVEDMGGHYGITHGAMGIQVTDHHELENLKKILKTDEFRRIIDACMFSSFRIDWNLFKYFRRDFWKRL